MSGRRKFSSGKLYNLGCLLPYIRERYTFLNIFIKENKVQGSTSTSTQPAWPSQALIVFPVLFCPHFFLWCFVRRNLWIWRQSFSWPWESVIKSVFMVLGFEQWTVLYEPTFLGLDLNCQQLMAERLHQSSATCGISTGYPKGTVIASFSTQTHYLPPSSHVSTCIHKFDFLQLRPGKLEDIKQQNDLF